MSTRGGVLHARGDVRAEEHDRPPARLPSVIYVLALGTFLMGTTEFVVAGLLPQIAGNLQVSVAQAGLLITVFAVGMIVGAPLMAMLTLRLPKRLTLMLALGVFAAGHVVGVPLGAFAGQLMGWRGPFWALAALAAAAIALIARAVPHDGPAQHAGSLRSELAALRSGRLWLVLAACATTTGGVLAAYSYISPLLTGRAGLSAGLLPLALVGFGVGALAGSIVGGRLGDARPHTVTIVAAAGATLLLLAICLLSGYAAATVLLVALLGFFGLGANPVLMSLAVRFAGRAPVLASALTISAFNFGTAVGSWIAGLALGSSLGTTGPAVVGTAIAALTLIPTIAIALTRRRHSAAAATT
ncbi:MFS transporter [Nonomuraea angiospora]|uniref:DHA1 family inner membrane transport protein n=1 Tax=Nonomuraea angiospora TaxID=46172 RepID=A0ABR9LRU1_9ACTN|nr:MFS transporter [Nonomuraea angiospora]MBE1582973.1 DHA1 family inner membrane transport protein [Nonomuraea angiospora]